jgi:hypothetical protein
MRLVLGWCAAVTMLEGGGHVAEIVLTEGRGVNPLWIQARPTIDPDQYEPARHRQAYGGGSGARLMSGLAGPNVCFPYRGGPSPAEAKAGMTYHGETGVVRWVRVEAAGDRLVAAAGLPESRTRFVRSLEVGGWFSWLNIWEANNPQILTRGLEFSDTKGGVSCGSALRPSARAWRREKEG